MCVCVRSVFCGSLTPSHSILPVLYESMACVGCSTGDLQRVLNGLITAVRMGNEL